MKFKANINIMPLETLLDPQGKAVSANMKNVGINEVSNVRIGKHITLTIEATSKEEASEKVTEACQKILSNQIMESYDFDLEEL
ncbi:MAG: phosphoribosylformylglycinamidine synthase subunit PurS [Bacteroidota bacterium]|nr:phosphoribosylformylglycinamidine synthase subunit PurS [Bacteroidota bacterium]